MACAYRGRFAPSPTGPLHFGSLVAAIGSYADARAHDGKWLVRIEDLDRARCVEGAAGSMLADLARFGMTSDEPVVVQSERGEHYRGVLRDLRSRNATFDCGCSRRDLEGAVYSGTCRRGLPPGKQPRSVRVCCHEPREISFHDAIQGDCSQQLARDVGDFVVSRADGVIAYHLAVVVDDAAQSITHVVRGADLLESTPRQIYLQQQLKLPRPAYAHLPVATNASGQKLSKQTHAPAISDASPPDMLWRILRFLGQEPPPHLRNSSLDQLWSWTASRWDIRKIPRQLQRRPD